MQGTEEVQRVVGGVEFGVRRAMSGLAEVQI